MSDRGADLDPKHDPGHDPGLTPDIVRRAAGLRWLLLDVDGVLTDGSVQYGPDGEVFKSFHTADGLGLVLLRSAGFQVGLLTGRADGAVLARARELGLDELISGRSDKAPAFADFLRRREARAEEVAYVGDDLTDLPVILTCGLSFAPANAVDEVKRRAHVVLERSGGRAAVREAVELLLRARGEWDGLVQRFLPNAAPEA